MPIGGYGGGVAAGLHGGMGNLPLQPGVPPALQYRPAPGCENPLDSPGGYRSAPIDPTDALLQGIDEGSKKLMDMSLDDLERFVRNSIFWNQPSPLQAPPYRGYYKEITTLVVIGPPTDVATAAATAGALALAAGANTTQDPNNPVTVETPSTGGEWVDIATFQTPTNQAYMIYSIEAWGHDWLGSLNAVQYRVLNAGTPVLDGRPLGVMGEQVRIQSLVRPGNVLTIQATTWDGSSGTLVNVRMQGWIFPLPNTDDDMWALVRQADTARSAVAVPAGARIENSTYGSPQPYSRAPLPAPPPPPPPPPQPVRIPLAGPMGGNQWTWTYQDPRNGRLVSVNKSTRAAFYIDEAANRTRVGPLPPPPGYDPNTLTVG